MGAFSQCIPDDPIFHNFGAFFEQIEAFPSNKAWFATCWHFWNFWPFASIFKLFSESNKTIHKEEKKDFAFIGNFVI